METTIVKKRWLDYWLKKGTSIEMEHIPSLRKMYPEFKAATYVHTDKDVAEAIAWDHLQEHPLYYKYLTKMEKKLKKLKK